MVPVICDEDGHVIDGHHRVSVFRRHAGIDGHVLVDGRKRPVTADMVERFLRDGLHFPTHDVQWNRFPFRRWSYHECLFNDLHESCVAAIRPKADA